jgi:exodeoxyribonuclease VII small subunit
MAKSKLTFEQALQKLEAIVDTLETNELDLEKALKQFEEGMTLSHYCSQKLEETEKKISLILEKAGGTIEREPFSPSKPDQS